MTDAARLNAERTRQMCNQRVWATPAAVEAIIHLRTQIGNLVLRHVADESGEPEVRLASSRTPCGPDDIAVGIVGGVLFLIDRAHDVALGCPDFHVDATPTQLHNDEAGIRAQYHLVSRAVPHD